MNPRSIALPTLIATALLVSGCTGPQSANSDGSAAIASASSAAPASTTPSVAPTAPSYPSLEEELVANVGPGYRLESSENPGVTVTADEADRVFAPYNPSIVLKGDGGAEMCALLKTAEGPYGFIPYANTPEEGFAAVFTGGC